MPKTAVCPECYKVFGHRKNLYQHQRNIHNSEPNLLEYPKNFTCDACGISFTFIQNLYRHKKKIHNVSMSVTEKHECIPCNESFRTQHGYLRHLAMAHNEESKTFMFSSKREFEVWKTEEEEKSQALFSTRSCYRVFKNARRTNFLCHRYGEFKSKSTGRRCLKVQGSTREGNHCTARMEVTEFQNGEVRVIYFPKHKMHQDSVNYADRKDKAGSLWLSMDDNSSLVVERIISSRKGRIRLSDIRDVHRLAQRLDTSHILKTDQTNPAVFTVRSEKDPLKTYRVSRTGNLCYPSSPARKCNLICSMCDICIHEYKCSCDNWAHYGGLMCKHIHLVASSQRNPSLHQSPDREAHTHPRLWSPDDSIFVEIEVNGDEESEEIDLPLMVSETTGFDLAQDEINLSTFESIMNFGKNAAVSQLDPYLIRKINTSAHEYISLLQSLVTDANVKDQHSISYSQLENERDTTKTK